MRTIHSNDLLITKDDVKQQRFSVNELETIRMICRQHTSKEIAKKLGLSQRTIEDIREKILKKTNSKSFVGIVLFAVRNKLVVLDDL